MPKRLKPAIVYRLDGGPADGVEVLTPYELNPAVAVTGFEVTTPTGYVYTYRPDTIRGSLVTCRHAGDAGEGGAAGGAVPGAA